MVTRREFIVQGAAGAACLGSGSALANAGRIRSEVRRDETILRLGGNGDNWHMSWALDDRQYLSFSDGTGFSDPAKSFFNSRMLAVSGSPQEARFDDVSGYPQLGTPTQTLKDPRYYGFGTLALDGRLYHFLSTISRAPRPDELSKPDFNDLLRFNGVKLIHSLDGGRSWRNQDGSNPVKWESWSQRSQKTMLFFEEDQDSFSVLSVLQMGKNYQFNRDGYIYLYAPNGNKEGKMNELVLARVPKRRVIDRGCYEFFSGNLSNGQAKWVKSIESRKPVLIFPRGWVNRLPHPFAWVPSVIYNAPLDLYMLISWGTATAPDGMWFSKPSYLGLWTSRDPWGPWTQVYEEPSWQPAGDAWARAYSPQFAPKWIGADGKSFWLAWSDYQLKDEQEYARFFNDYQEKGRLRQLTEEDEIQRARTIRKHRPYYSFNIQRFDLLVT